MGGCNPHEWTGCKEAIRSVITLSFDCVSVCMCMCMCVSVFVSVCAHTYPHVGHCKTGFTGLVDGMRIRTSAAAITSSSVGDAWCALVISKTSSFDVPGTGCTVYEYIAQGVQYQVGCRVKTQWCCVITTGTPYIH